MYKILALILSLITTQSYSQKRTLKIQDGVLTIWLKDDWKVFHEKELDIVQFHPGGENVVIGVISKDNNSLDVIFSNYMNADVPSLHEDYKVVDRSEVIINDENFMQFAFDTKVHGKKIRYYTYMVANDFHVYYFLFSTRVKNADKYHAIFKDFLNAIDFGSPKIIVDSNLELLIDKKWVLSGSTSDGFPDTNAKEHYHYFVLSGEGMIKFHYRNNDLMFESLYTYDPGTQTIEFYRESRPVKLTIESISGDKVNFTGLDYLKSKISRVYRSKL